MSGRPRMQRCTIRWPTMHADSASRCGRLPSATPDGRAAVRPARGVCRRINARSHSEAARSLGEPRTRLRDVPASTRLRSPPSSPSRRWRLPASSTPDRSNGCSTPRAIPILSRKSASWRWVVRDKRSLTTRQALTHGLGRRRPRPTVSAASVSESIIWLLKSNVGDGEPSARIPSAGRQRDRSPRRAASCDIAPPR